MKKFLQALGRGLLATVAFLLILEIIFRFLGAPAGASRFAETVVLKNNLSSFKPAGETRIFAYGTSSMHGAHYAPVSSPARWAEAYMKDFLPSKNIRVVNFARMGQGSTYTYETVRDTLSYKPDYIILYMGHNEFLPGAQVKNVKAKQAKPGNIAGDWAKQSRFLSAVIRYAVSKRLDRGQDSMSYAAIEAMPSDIGPENAVTRLSPAYKEGVDNFRKNMDAILDLAAQKRIPVIVFRPAGNLKNFPPSCSQHFTKLKPEDEKNWKELFEAGKKAQEAGDFSGALAFYENANSIDSDYADLNFRIAQIYFQQGDLERAKELFERSRENDCIITRATSGILKVIDDVKASNRAVVLDAEKILRSEVPGGIMGDPVIEDNVHYSVKAQSLLGRVIAQEFADRDWIAAKDQWQFQRERSFEEMAKELGVTPQILVHSYLEVANYFGRKYDNRILMAKKAMAIEPENPRVRRQLAWSYWLKGDKANAVEAYRQLGKIDAGQLKEAVANYPEIQKALAEAKVS